MLYLRVWVGEDTDWVTVTPNNPDDCDSSEFDEGICTGYLVPNSKTQDFITDYLAVMNKYSVTVNVV